MIQVQSAGNENFKRWKTLSSSKGIKKSGEFILMGEKLVREFLRKPGSWVVKAELLSGEQRPVSKAKVFELAPVLFKELDVLGTGFNLLVLEAPEISAADLSSEASGLELVCPLGDPSNLGAIVRSALAFGVSKVILTEEAAHPLHPKSVKASAGAVLTMKFERAGALKNYVATGGSAALDMDGEDVTKFQWPKNLRLIVGEEGPGLPTLSGVRRLSIPSRSVESLNATVAASLALFLYSQKVGRSF